jgi:hypothetical protein
MPKRDCDARRRKSASRRAGRHGKLARMRSARAAVSVLLACSACSSSPPEARSIGASAPASAASVVATTGSTTRFRGAISVKAVSLAHRSVAKAETALAAAANDRLGTILDCLAPLPPKETQLWFVGQFGADGKLGTMMVDGEGPAAVVACAKSAMSRVRVDSSAPLAFSVYLRAEPAPSGCSGDECTRTPVPPDAEGGSTDAPGEGGPSNALGALRGENGAELFGPIQLGAAGGALGPGGGQCVGLGSIGTIGHGGGGEGFGARGTRGDSPHVRVGDTAAHGGLPPEIIKRIVRVHIGAFRRCYEYGLQHDPALRGKVKVTFVIGLDGNVTGAADDKSDLPDKGVVSCVVSEFAKLTFPSPKGGVVRVTYPIDFAPDEEATPAPVLTIGGTSFKALEARAIGDKLERAGWSSMTVGGAAPGDAFVCFAFPKDAKFDPTRSFVTTLSRAGDTWAPGDRTVESEGVRLVASGAFAEKLLADVVDKER